MTPVARTNLRRGFTLIELMISAGLMAIILGAAYACLRAGLESRKVIEPRSDVYQAGRVALALIGSDLRAACPMHKGPAFLGEPRKIESTEADAVDFATHNYTPSRPGEGDYCSVSWFVERDPRTGASRLWRRRNPTFAFDPLSGGSREEIATGVRGFKVEYYDGFDWYDTWGDPTGGAKQANSNRDRPNLTGLPEAVRVTILLDGEFPSAKGSASPEERPAPPVEFEAVVRLNLSGATSASSSAGSNTAGSSPNRQSTEERSR